MSYARRDGAVARVTVDEANRRPTALKAFLRVAERAFSYFREDSMAARSRWSRGDDRESIRLFVCRGPRLFAPRRPLRVVVAGPCGGGKTTVGKELSKVLGLPFIEGDDLHPPENVAKMKRGEPLDFPVTGVIKGWIAALQMMQNKRARRHPVLRRPPRRGF